MNNGEGEVLVKSVRVHETDTGYCEALVGLNDIVFSDAIKDVGKDLEMYDKLMQFNKSGGNKPFVNGAIDLIFGE